MEVCGRVYMLGWPKVHLVLSENKIYFFIFNKNFIEQHIYWISELYGQPHSLSSKSIPFDIRDFSIWRFWYLQDGESGSVGVDDEGVVT